MTIIFGDFDPDDAYDATDTAVAKLRNIARRIPAVADNPTDVDRLDRLLDDVLDVIQQVIDRRHLGH